MAVEVEFHPLAEGDLFDLYDYIADRAGPVVAGGYIDRIEMLCASLSTLPDRGTPRDDLGLGIRTVSLERRASVVYRSTVEKVLILRVVYAGRNFGPDDLPH